MPSIFLLTFLALKALFKPIFKPIARSGSQLDLTLMHRRMGDFLVSASKVSIKRKSYFY